MFINYVSLACTCVSLHRIIPRPIDIRQSTKNAQNRWWNNQYSMGQTWSYWTLPS